MPHRQRLPISRNPYTAREIGEDEKRGARANRRNICKFEEGAMKPNQIVSREEWLRARKTLLEKDKAHMRERDR
jgi:hypothetical protein